MKITVAPNERVLIEHNEMLIGFFDDWGNFTLTSNFLKLSKPELDSFALIMKEAKRWEIIFQE